MDEGVEEGAAEGGVVVGAFGVPLDAEDEVVWGLEFDGFDDAVLGADGGDEEVVAGGLNRLVVAGVDEDGEGKVDPRG